MNITVIGAGNMGGALVKGWYAASAQGCHVEEDDTLQLTVTARSQSTLDRMRSACPGISTSLSNTSALTSADVVVLAVKPWLIQQVIQEIASALDARPRLVCSVAAGVSATNLQQLFHQSDAAVEHAYFYCMPNIGAEFQASMTFLSPASGTSPADLARVESLFSLVGRTQVVDDHLMGPGMMMAGCGIAYVMRFVRAQMEAGVEMGFYPRQALDIALQTMEGATALLRATGEHPEAAIDRVTTPGGVTIKGLNELDHAGFNSAVIRCLKAGLH